MADTEHKIVFGVSGPDARGTVTLLVGVPEAAWDYMKDGKTHHFDLTRTGLPIQLMLYGAKDHDAAMKVMEDAMAIRGVPYDDRRREDFSIQPAKPEGE